MAPADFRTPAIGRYDLTWRERQFVVWGSFVPGIHGGRLALRLLDRAVAMVPWDKVFTRPENEQAAGRLMKQPNGLVLVTGPTGSGKTTVLYTMVNRVAGEGVNCMSAENPVEFDLPWVAQTSVNPKAGFGFADALQWFTRQDPDVIMVGDVPDLDTALMGVELAATGHLVLAQLHAQDTLSTLAYLRDLGLAPFHLANVLSGVISMRLVRCICNECRTEATVRSTSALVALGMDERIETVQAGRGCSACHGTGFRRRTALMEVMEVNDALRDAIARDAPAEVLRELAFTPDLPDFRGQAAWLIEQGVTTPEEAYRVLYRVL
jgi:type II secretory ATPase GspE/PulE/Tfp pilus assembly ATPase PilB-like protein